MTTIAALTTAATVSIAVTAPAGMHWFRVFRHIEGGQTHIIKTVILGDSMIAVLKSLHQAASLPRLTSAEN